MSRRPLSELAPWLLLGAYLAGTLLGVSLFARPWFATSLAILALGAFLAIWSTSNSREGTYPTAVTATSLLVSILAVVLYAFRRYPGGGSASQELLALVRRSWSEPEWWFRFLREAAIDLIVLAVVVVFSDMALRVGPLRLRRLAWGVLLLAVLAVPADFARYEREAYRSVYGTDSDPVERARVLAAFEGTIRKLALLGLFSGAVIRLASPRSTQAG